MIWNPEQLWGDFLAAAKGGKIEIPPDAVKIKTRPMPHTRPSFPKNTKAVYVFSTDTQVLKVGKDSSQTGTRYTNHHYNPKSSNSNLAKSLLEDQDIVQEHGLNENNVGEWIMANTDRVNFLFDADVVSTWVLNLFEAFVQCRLEPRYEGPESSH